MTELELELIATDDGAQTVTVAINGKRYTYYFKAGYIAVLDQFRHLMKHSKGRALVLLKRCATTTTKEEPNVRD